MKLRLVREILTAQSTIGRLFIDDVFKCWTLEDIDRELTTEMSPAEIWNKKVFGRTAIPRGSYKVIVNMSSKFKKIMPLLCDVPGFAGIRIHPGNNATHTEGCILPGISHGLNEIYNSRQAFNLIFPMIEHAHTVGEPITIEVVKQEIVKVNLPPVPTGEHA